MNYGLDDVLGFWGGATRLANPAAGLRTAMERSAFVDLFDSDVRFAELAGGAAVADKAPDVAEPGAVEPRAKAMPTTQRSIAESTVPAAASAATQPMPAAQVPTPATQRIVAAGGLVQPLNVAGGNVVAPASARTVLEPAFCQWSRTAFTACMRDGELNLVIRDDTLSVSSETVKALKQALREMGIGLAKLKINGINAGA